VAELIRIPTTDEVDGRDLSDTRRATIPLRVGPRDYVLDSDSGLAGDRGG